MKKILKVLFVGLLCLFTLPQYSTFIFAQELKTSSTIQPRDVQTWYGTNTFTFENKTITIAAWASMYNNHWTASARVIKGDAYIINAYNDQASSSVHGNVQVNGHTYSFSIRVYPTN